MVKVRAGGQARAGGEAIRNFIVENVAANSARIVPLAAEHFGCTRQAVHKHVRRLVEESALVVTGTTRNRRYALAPLAKWIKRYDLEPRLSEDKVWREDLSPSLGKLPENVLSIWHYGFTEIFNNVIEHSEASVVTVEMERTAAATSVYIIDDGVGIFKKIQAALNLDDERHSVVELAKGKFTTDPKNHSGEGIFFSSRMFDEFEILSGETYFSHEFGKKEDWILQQSSVTTGTLVRMVLHNHTARTTKKVFDAYTSGEDYGFNKTIVPVKLMQYGDDNLVSRSQAKRLLGRFDRFKIVMLNFSGIATIGQAFADELFRVFPARHPDVALIETDTSAEVQKMISRARVLAASEGERRAQAEDEAGPAV